MKLKIYLYALIAGQLLLFSCKKNKDNLTYSPKVSSNTASGTLVAYDGNISVPFTIYAPGEIEQVDYKIWGASYDVTNSAGNKVDESLSVPYDWVGIKSLRSGFDDKENFKMNVNLTSVKTKATITVQVIDKNNFKSSVTIVINPVIEGTLVTNATLYTQRATAADAGTEGDRFLFLGSSNASGYDTATAKSSGTDVDIAFADSASLGTTVILSSPDAVKANSGNAAGTLSIGGSKTTVFVTTSLDASTATLSQVLAVSLAGAKSYVAVSAGSSYIYKNSDGAIGILKVNSIGSGSSSGNPNAELNVTFRYNGPPLN